MGNTWGRSVIIPLTNKSGGAVVAGDVVVVDSANDDAFTTTTTGGFTGGIGIAQEGIASNATGRVLIYGYASLVNVNASVTRGHYGKTHTVAKQASDAGTTRTAGTFCIFLTDGTTPEALVYPPDLSAAALTNPMTTTSDLIYSTDNSGTPGRLALGAAGGALSRVNGAVAYNSGTSFPTAAAGDRYWRTDLGMEFYYDGTRWLTTKLYIENLPPYIASGMTQPISTAGTSHRGVLATDLFDLWLVDVRVLGRVNTTNDGTKYWTFTFQKYSVAGGGVDLAVPTSAAWTHDVITRTTTAVGAALGGSGMLILQVNIAKASTPGTLDAFACGYSYRLIGT